LRRIQFVLVNSQMRRSEQPGMGLEIVFGGQKHFITADRLQILNLLLSTYEAAMQRNAELSSTRDTLRQTNLDLRQLTLELEDRVLMRTRELELSNEALRQAQQALIQQERLRALGQMASGIAHDINNAISPIALYTESMLERETNLSSEARDRLVTIQRAIDDVAQTVARMREFYRPREPELELADVELNRLVQQIIELTRARWSDQPQRRGIMIELRLGLAPDLLDVRGADNEIRDALTNLIFNAVDAMPDGGVIEVRTSMPTVPAQGSAATRHVWLEVSDTGVGMDEETRRPLPRAVLHHQGRTRYRAGSGDGLRDGATPWLRARDRQQARRRHHHTPRFPSQLCGFALHRPSARATNADAQLAHTRCRRRFGFKRIVAQRASTGGTSCNGGRWRPGGDRRIPQRPTDA